MDREERRQEREERRLEREGLLVERSRQREDRGVERPQHDARSIGGGAAAGFLPWIIFWVVSSPSTWKVAAVAALVAAVVVSIPDATRSGGIKELDLGTIVFFAVVSILAIFLDRKDLSWFEDWAQFISSMALAAIAFVSLAFTPFTEQYARDSTPRELWNTPGFKRINRQLTIFWGVVFLLTAVSGVLAVKGSHSTRDFFTWILPIILIVGAFKLQRRYSTRGRAPERARPPSRRYRGRRPYDLHYRLPRRRRSILVSAGPADAWARSDIPDDRGAHRRAAARAALVAAT